MAQPSPPAPHAHRLETQLVHAGEPRPGIGAALVLPIFRSTVYETAGGGDYHALLYPRLGNLPNHTALSRTLAALEGGEDAQVTASGMAAIATSLLTVLGGGGHVLVQSCLYGGVHDLLAEDFPDFGIESTPIDAEDPSEWKRALRPNTRAIYVETLTNPTLRVADHRAVVAFAREHGLVSMIDNTFATPVNFRPLEQGFDLSLHSCTKYLNGHTDVVAGAVVGSATWLEKIRHRLNRLGGCLDPGACFLLQRGIKTLALRVREQNRNALALARWLEARTDVAVVNHPGLESHPHHARARELFEGSGGMFSFELEGGVERTTCVLDRLEIPTQGPSLGGVETLVTRPAATSHAGMSPEARAAAGIGDALVRISVGIEATEDLIADFERALAG